MDEYLERLFYSPSWMTDANDSSRSAWEGTALSNISGLLSDPSQTFGVEKSRSTGMFPLSTTLLNAAAEDLNHHVNDETSSVMLNGLKSSQQKSNSQNSFPTLMNNVSHDRKFSLHGAIDGCGKTGSFESTITQKVVPISSSIESSESELSAFPQSFGDGNSITSVPTLWHSSYPSISTVMGQGKLQDFGFQGAESRDYLTGKSSFENGKFLHLDVIPPISTHLQDSNEHKYSSFSAGQQMHLSTGILPPQKEESAVHLPSFPSLSQSPLNKTNNGYPTISASGTQSHVTAANGNNGNGTGTVKPRVRARRGQATDPHSIAERLRREKIAERMKNLQELVPNSNKTDKASMLDEIIDYVKFLQLQVKVLSMSRLGAAGAVVPLLTDNQAEGGSGTLLLSSPFGQDGADLSDSEDSLAFEQEVLKLMETNITNAMQYLQHKGLCLMPIALAAAIPSQKGSSTVMPSERKRTDITNSRSSYNYGERESPEDEADIRNADCLKQEVYKSTDDNKEMIPKERRVS